MTAIDGLVEEYRKQVYSAIEAVSAKRKEGYGSAFSSFTRISIMWKSYMKMRYGVDVDLQADDVGFMMELFKMCREVNSPNIDNGIDGVNYASFGYALNSVRGKVNKDTEEDVLSIMKEWGFPMDFLENKEHFTENRKHLLSFIDSIRMKGVK